MSKSVSLFNELSILQTGKTTVSMHSKLKSLMNAMRDGKTVVTPVMRFSDVLVFATIKREVGEFGEWTVRLYRPTPEAVSHGYKYSCELSPSVVAINTDSVSRAYMVVFGQLGLPYMYLDVAPEDDTMIALDPAAPTALTALLEAPNS